MELLCQITSIIFNYNLNCEIRSMDMSNERLYDAIIIGAGLGGLSTACFLAGEGRKVLVLEKHDKPGGLVTSFSRNGVQFDIGLEGLFELKEKETVHQFLHFWGISLETVRRHEKIRAFVGDEAFSLDADSLEEDFTRAFPQERAAVARFFALNKKILVEMYSGEAPKPPYEMPLWRKIVFGMQTALRKPAFLKYGFKDSSKVLRGLFTDKRLLDIIYAKAMVPMVYMGYVYRWETMRRNELFYPVGGMQRIPDAMVAMIRKAGGEVRLRTEATRIVMEDGRAVGVECAVQKRAAGEQEIDGDIGAERSVFRGRNIISNASPQYTANVLGAGIRELDPLRAAIRDRRIFPSGMLCFIGVRAEYDFKGVNFISITSGQAMNLRPEEYTPGNCPIAVIVGEKPADQKDHSVVVLAPVPYEYQEMWRTTGSTTTDSATMDSVTTDSATTGGASQDRRNDIDGGSGMIRGKAYRELKEQAGQILLDRICDKLGDEFRRSVLFSIPSTPLTIERYTNSAQGSFMGWSIDAKDYGKFLPQTTPVKNLFLVGQWVFPGFGVAGVTASGYFLAKRLLAADSIDLEQKFKSFCDDFYSKM
jgi:phytoene dehydrogenase-like protein